MSSYAFRSSSRGSRQEAFLQALQEEESEEEDLGPVTPEERAAVAVGLDVAFPNTSERRVFKDLLRKRGGPEQYILVRRVCLGVALSRAQRCPCVPTNAPRSVVALAGRAASDAWRRRGRRNKILLLWEEDNTKQLTSKAAGALCAPPCQLAWSEPHIVFRGRTSCTRVAKACNWRACAPCRLALRDGRCTA